MQHSGASFLHTIPQEFLNDAVVLHFGPGEYIKCAGDDFDRFCILQKGSCKLVYEAENTSLIIDLYHEGDFFGEMEAIGMQTTDRSLIALTDCQVLCFTKEQFRHMWSTCSDMSMYIFTVHCERLM